METRAGTGRRAWWITSLGVFGVAAVVVGALALAYGIPPNLVANTSTHPRTLALALGVLALFVVAGWGLYRLTHRAWVGALVQASIAAVVIGWAVVPTLRGTEVQESDPLAGATVAESAVEPAVLPSEIGAAAFVGIDHEVTGVARLLDLGDRRVLRFENFEVEAGPDYFVHLVDGPDVRTPEPVRLGALKGTRGDQNYEVPAEMRIGPASTVLIWCRVFDVPVANATIVS